jgi:hypothetical protein
MGAVLAHEYGHVFLFTRRFPALSLQTEEGICELFAWLWLGGGAGARAGGKGGGSGTINGEDEGQNARRRRLMESRKDAVYGDGTGRPQMAPTTYPFGWMRRAQRLHSVWVVDCNLLNLAPKTNE